MAVVLLAGQIGVGKSSVAKAVADTLGVPVLSVRTALRISTGADENDRSSLQQLGADLDRRTRGRWLLHFVDEHVTDPPGAVVDAMRTRRQTVPLLEHLNDARLIYLNGSETTRRRRFALAARTDRVKASVNFDVAMHHTTELKVPALLPLAHAVIDTDDLSLEQTAAEVLAALPH